MVFLPEQWSTAAEKAAQSGSVSLPSRQITNVRYEENSPLFVTEAKTLDPDLEMGTVYNLISYYRNTEKTEELIAAYEDAIQKWPESTGLKNSYASSINSMEIENKYDYGIKMLEKAIKENPDSVYISYTLGLLYHKKGELEKAIAEIEKVVERYPTRKVYSDALEKIKKELEEQK